MSNPESLTDALPGVHVELVQWPRDEALRTNLASVILQMKALRLGDIADFPFIEPPDYRMIRDGLATLHELGAIDANNEIADFSSRGPGQYKGTETKKPEVSSPGVDVHSAAPGGGCGFWRAGRPLYLHGRAHSEHRVEPGQGKYILNLGG